MENPKIRSRVEPKDDQVRKVKKEVSALWIIYAGLIGMILCGFLSCTNLLTVMKGQGNQFHHSQETTTSVDSANIHLNTK